MTCVQLFRAGFYVVFVVTLLHFIVASICDIIEFIVMIVSLGNALCLSPSLSIYPWVEMRPSDKLPEVSLRWINVFFQWIIREFKKRLLERQRQRHKSMI